MPPIDELRRLSRFYTDLLRSSLSGSEDGAEDIDACRNQLEQNKTREPFKRVATEQRLVAELTRRGVEPREPAALILALAFLRLHEEVVSTSDVKPMKAKKRALRGLIKALDETKAAFRAEPVVVFQSGDAFVERKLLLGEASAVDQFLGGYVAGIDGFTEAIRALATVYDEDDGQREERGPGRPRDVAFRALFEVATIVNAIEKGHGRQTERWSRATLGVLLSFWRLPNWTIETDTQEIVDRAEDLK